MSSFFVMNLPFSNQKTQGNFLCPLIAAQLPEGSWVAGFLLNVVYWGINHSAGSCTVSKSRRADPKLP
jgi:hypothetical protein